MSQLTSEERDLYEKATSLPFLADDESSVVPGLIRTINRLSARVGEIEELKGHPQIYKHTAQLAKENRKLRDNLSSILSAVEPFLRKYESLPKAYEAENAPPEDDRVIKMDIRVGNLRNLNQVAKKIKGEK